MVYPIFSYQILIREHHLDTFGHVNNAKYLEIFEEARWEIMVQTGLTMQAVHASGLGPTILEFHVAFKKELRVRKSVIIRTQLQSFERKVGVLRQWIEDEEGNLYCDATMKFGIFDLRQRKLIESPTEWIEAFSHS